MAPLALAQTDGGNNRVGFSPAPEPHPKLRIGLFADSRLQPRALVEAFADIALSDYADIVVIAVDHRAVPALPWLWRIYDHIDRRIFGVQPDSSKPVDLFSHLASGRILRIPDTVVGDSVPADWVAKVNAFNLDVAFVLGEIDIDAIKSAAKYGVWRFCFGVRQGALDMLDGFREVLDGSEVTASSLSASSIADSERLLYQSWSCTSPFSVTRNRDKLLRRAAQFPARVLKELHRSGGVSLATCVPPNHSSSVKETTSPLVLDTPRSMARVGWRIVRRGLQKLFCIDQWFIGYRFCIGAGGQPEVGQFSRLMPPKDRFWADPFPIQRNGRYYIFFEELVFAAGKAHISMVEVDRHGNCSEPERVLERPYHLSYPFLIEADGELFMVPETAQNRSVELYRCVRFPDRWRLEKMLLNDVYCVDATFHHTDGKWWMFANIAENDTSIHDELHIYYADSLCGEWKSHRGNPVKSDVRSARPAGRLYERNGRLYRPAQNCAPRYGSGISINQVLALSPETYLEREIERIAVPLASNTLGIHTLNRAGDLCVVDGFVRRKRLGRDEGGVFAPHRLGPGQPSETAYGQDHAI